MKNAWMKGALALAALACSAGASWSQSASELPGMDAVMAVRQLSHSDVNANWLQYAADATLASQGWIESNTLKEGLLQNETVVLPGVDVASEILALGLQPQPQPVAYKTAHATYVILAAQGMMDKWTGRYIVNAQARLK